MLISDASESSEELLASPAKKRKTPAKPVETTTTPTTPVQANPPVAATNLMSLNNQMKNLGLNTPPLTRSKSALLNEPPNQSFTYQIDLIFDVLYPMLPGILRTIAVCKIECPGGIDLDSLEADYCKRKGVQQIVLTYDEDVNVTKARYQVPRQYTTNSNFSKAYIGRHCRKG